MNRSNRKREPDHARTPGPRPGARRCRLVSGLHAGPRRRRHRPRQRPGSGSRRRSISRSSTSATRFREDQDNVTRVRPFVEDDDYSATLLEARSRLAGRARDRDHRAPARRSARREPDDRYDIKDLAVAPDGLHVAFAMRGPLDDVDDEDEPPTWNIWEYNIATDTLHRVITLRHHRGGRPGRGARLSTRRPHPVFLDAPAPGEGHPARRGQGAVRSRDRSAQRIRVRAARHERRRHRHPPDLLQPVERPVRPGAAERPRVVHALGSRARPRRPAPLHHQPRRHRHAAALRRGLAPDRHRGRRREHRRSNSCARARCSDGRLMVLTRQRTDVDFGGNLTIIDANRFVENTQPLLANAGTRRPGADAGDAQRRAHGSRSFARRPLQLRLPALGRLGPHPRELDAVPAVRRRRSDAHRALHRRPARRSGRCRPRRRCTASGCSRPRRTPSCRSCRRSKA